MIATNRAFPSRPSWLAEPLDAGRTPRILLLSASVGCGHLRAAEAIELALRDRLPNAVIRNEDALALASRPMRFSFADCYLYLSQKVPLFVGYIYDRIDQPRKVQDSRLNRLKVFLERMNMRRLVQLLTGEPWDLVINTFFLSTEIVASLRRNGQFNAPQVQVVTDYETHRNWVNFPCELYCTATEESARYLECFGVPPGTAITTGIPIHPAFCERKERAECLRRQGLVGDRPIVLLLGGGHGVGPLEDIFRALLQIERPLEIIVVTGWNTAARPRLEEVAASSTEAARHRCHVLGYTHDMADLMAVADLTVTKPGGLTVAEALASGTGLVLVHPVPGQEERNSDYLLENGAAIKVNHIPTLSCKLTPILQDPQRLATLRANALRLAHPRAAFDIVDHSLALIPWLCPGGNNRDTVSRVQTNGEGSRSPLAQREEVL